MAGQRGAEASGLMPQSLGQSPPTDPKLSPAQQQQRWVQLEQRIAKLEHQQANAVKYGPVPGQAGQEIFGDLIRAGRILSITSAPGQAFMEMDWGGSTASIGTPPMFILNDGTRARVQVGNLAAYTDPTGVASPAGYGVRVLDASGNIIFDSVGISSVGTPAGVAAQAPGQNFSNTPYAATPGTAINFIFTLTRQVRVLFIVGANCHVQSGSGLVYVRTAIYTNPGGGLVAATGDAKFQGANLQNQTPTLLTGAGAVGSIGPGGYLVQLECKCDSGSTGYFDSGSIIGIELGG